MTTTTRLKIIQATSWHCGLAVVCFVVWMVGSVVH